MDRALEELIRSRAKLDLEDRRNATGRAIAQISEEAGSRGMFHSSGRVVMIQAVVARETRIRASLAWNTCARALGASGIALDQDLALEIKGLIRDVVRGASDDLVEHLSKAAAVIKMKGPVTESEPLFLAAFDRIDSEIDFAVLASTAPGRDESSPSVINIYQAQGIVQTGPGSSANLTVQLPPEDKAQISMALTAVVEAIERDSSMGPKERAHALEVARDAQAEVEVDSPNRLRLRGSLSALASTVQTLASAPQAYELLKSASALLGLNLP